MANVKVSLVIYAKTDEGWVRRPSVRGGNGRIRPGYGMVDGKPKKFEKYVYQLRTYEGSRLVYQTVDAATASAQQFVRERTRAAAAHARAAGVTVVDDGTRRALKKAADDYIERTTNKRKLVAAEVYRTSLDLFQLSVPDVMYIDQITESTLLTFHAYLRKRGNSERTIANRHSHVKSLLLWCGISREQIKKTMGDRPTFEKKKVVAYSRDEMSSLLAACDDPYFETVLRLLQMTGLREAEAAHLMWTDIDFKRKQILVRSKPELGFQLKDREERIVPPAGGLRRRYFVNVARPVPKTNWSSAPTRTCPTPNGFGC